MKKNRVHIFIFLFSIILFTQSCAQSAIKTDTKLFIENPEFDTTIKSYLDFSIPIISVDSLYKNYKAYHVLDAREPSEYNISHLPESIYIGYDNANLSVADNLDTSKDIVLYCSIGYRSEVIAKKLKKKGFNVLNLYGSIFEWVNSGFPLHDKNGNDTKNIHGYNKSWSKWIQNKEYSITY